MPAGVTLFCDLEGLTMMHKGFIVSPPPGILTGNLLSFCHSLISLSDY